MTTILETYRDWLLYRQKWFWVFAVYLWANETSSEKRLKVPKKGQHGQGGSKSGRGSSSSRPPSPPPLPPSKGLAKEIVVMEKELRNALPNVFYTCHYWSGLYTLKWFTSQVSQKFTPEYVMGELLNTPPYEQVGIQYLFIFDNTGLKTIIKPVIVLKD